MRKFKQGDIVKCIVPFYVNPNMFKYGELYEVMEAYINCVGIIGIDTNGHMCVCKDSLFELDICANRNKIIDNILK